MRYALPEMVEVKYREEPLAEGEVEGFMEKATQVAGEYGYREPVLWVVSRKGLTSGAERMLREQGMLHSDMKQFNTLAALLERVLLPS